MMTANNRRDMDVSTQLDANLKDFSSQIILSGNIPLELIEFVELLLTEGANLALNTVFQVQARHQGH